MVQNTGMQCWFVTWAVGGWEEENGNGDGLFNRGLKETEKWKIALWNVSADARLVFLRGEFCFVNLPPLLYRTIGQTPFPSSIPQSFTVRSCPQLAIHLASELTSTPSTLPECPLSVRASAQSSALKMLTFLSNPLLTKNVPAFLGRGSRGWGSSASIS